MKAKELLMIIALSIMLESFCVDAGMGMALGTWKNNARKTNPWGRSKSGQKVWNRRPTAERYRGWEDEDERHNRIDVGDNGNKPCVGMCYYKKVLALNNKIERQNAENEVMEKSAPEPEELKPLKPCVGLCQYYKSLGRPNPYEN
jgi:hypothetical protein